MVTSSYQRTQVYLDPDEHAALRELAAQRGVSMANLVREAVGRYLAGEGQAEDRRRTWWERYLDERGIPDGPAGLADALAALAEAEPPRDTERSDLTEDDRTIGEYLLREHEATMEAWRARRREREAKAE